MPLKEHFAALLKFSPSMRLVDQLVKEEEHRHFSVGVPAVEHLAALYIKRSYPTCKGDTLREAVQLLGNKFDMSTKSFDGVVAIYQHYFNGRIHIKWW